MQVLKTARRIVQDIDSTSQLLKSINAGVSNQSELINRKLSELIEQNESINARVSSQSELINGKLFELIGILCHGAGSDGTTSSSEFFGRIVKPLEKITNYPAVAGSVDLASLAAWRVSKEFQQTETYFAEYPGNSLVSRTGRAFLYHLVRTMRPATVVEIGTYYAASSEVMARAMWENGEGVVHTTDPYGAARCPAIIGQWPAALRRHVRFYPLNSMGLFSELERKKAAIDIAFIDGDHDFDCAYFDVLAAAKLMRPGGIIVLDNIEQCGPFWAGVEFMRTHPRWREVGDSISRFSPAKPFDDSRLFLGDASFVVLQAPMHHVITSAPWATGQSHYSHRQVDGVKLEIASAAPKGALHAQIILRRYYQGGAEQLIETMTVPIGGESGAIEVKLAAPLVSMLQPSIAVTHNTVETILFWQPDGHNEPLQLKALPEPVSHTTA